MIDIESLKPFPKFMYTIGMIPTSFKISLTYEEQVLTLMNFLKNDLIPVVNSNALATKELQQKFVELKNYVDDYFSDLNLQEQVNNKLNDMAESGELAEIINQEIFGELNEAVTNLQDRKIMNFLASEYDTLQEAINAAYAANDVVYLDENIEINEPSTKIDVKCSLYGLANAKITCSYLDIVEPNVTIDGIEIIGKSDRVININSSNSEIVKNNIKINNCKIHLNNENATLPYSIIYASLTTPINNLQISNNYITNSGIQLANCTEFRIENNYIDGLMNPVSENELIHTSFKSNGIITNNILCNCIYDFIDIFSAGEKTIITNNKMSNGKMNGIEAKVVLADGGQGSDTTNGFVQNCIISNNLIQGLTATDNGDYAGILAVMYDTRSNPTPTATENDVPKNLIITDNIIKDLNIGVGAKYCGIKTSANNTLIANNIIQNVHNQDPTVRAGIYYYTGYSTPTDFQIINNRLKGCYPSGIHIENGRNGIISGNTFQKDNEGTNTNYGNKYGVSIIMAYGLVITNNIFKQTASNGIIQLDNTNILSNINISNNNFNESSVLLTNITHSLINGNVFNKSHTTGQPSVKFDVSGAARRLVNIIGNMFYNLGTAMAINIKNMEYMNINENIFANCSYPIYLQNNCKKYNILNNISHTTTNANFINYNNVSAADQATMNIYYNLDDKS